MAEKEKTAAYGSLAIVLAPAGCERDVTRKLSLAREWQVTAHADPMAAMVDLALAVHALKTRRSAQSNGSHETVSFIIADPQACAVRETIRIAVAGYFPDVVMYDFDDHALREVGCKPARVAHGAAESGGRGMDPGRMARAKSSNGDNSSPTITREEIDMLLDRGSSDPPAAKKEKKKHKGGRK